MNKWGKKSLSGWIFCSVCQSIPALCHLGFTSVPMITIASGPTVTPRRAIGSARSEHFWFSEWLSRHIIPKVWFQRHIALQDFQFQTVTLTGLSLALGLHEYPIWKTFKRRRQLKAVISGRCQRIFILPFLHFMPPMPKVKGLDINLRTANPAFL